MEAFLVFNRPRKNFQTKKKKSILSRKKFLKKIFLGSKIFKKIFFVPPKIEFFFFCLNIFWGLFRSREALQIAILSIFVFESAVNMPGSYRNAVKSHQEKNISRLCPILATFGTLWAIFDRFWSILTIESDISISHIRRKMSNHFSAPSNGPIGAIVQRFVDPYRSAKP